MKLKEIKFKLTKSKETFIRPLAEIPEEEIIVTDYECRINDDGKNTPDSYTDGFCISPFLKENGYYNESWYLFLPIIYAGDYICRLKIMIPADINYEIHELIFEVDGRIITINKDSMKVIDKLIFVLMNYMMNKIEIKDGSLETILTEV
jgi:hypothetical protein